ncbi:MAG: ATP synthase F0 subunit B [Treponema sp.]|jgi:F-type H+-transporting ATPase subunit b|nr:ATP synthase F0 subunit B [Treponema sp.]
MLDFSVTFVITIINIAILFFILKALLFKPVTKFMAERAKRVQDSIDQAQRDREEAKALLAEYENRLKEAEAQAREIVKTAREDADRQARLIIAEGKREAQDAADVMRKQLEAERQAAVAKFKLEAASLVIAAGAKLAARDFSGEESRRYVNMLLDELSAKTSAQKGNR